MKRNIFAGTNLPSGVPLNTDGLRRFEQDAEDDDEQSAHSPILQSRPRASMHPPPQGPISQSSTVRPILPRVDSRLVPLPAPSVNSSTGRESRGNEPGTSGLPPRLQVPLTSRGASIVRLSLARTAMNCESDVSDTGTGSTQYSENLLSSQNMEDSDEEFPYDNISQPDDSLTFSRGRVVEETETSVTVAFETEVKQT